MLARSIHNTRRGGMSLSGSNLAYFTKNMTFTGFNQNVKVDSRGQVRSAYVVLDTDSTGSQLHQTYTVDLVSQRLRFAGRSISFPGGSPPSSDSVCWFDKNAVCTGGQPVTLGLQFSSSLPVLVFSLFIFRRGDHVHRGDIFCHIHSGHRRAHFKPFHQVKSGTFHS